MKKQNQRLKGLYRMPGSQFWWFHWYEDGVRKQTSLRTADEALAIQRGQAILAQGIVTSDEYIPRDEPAARRRPIHDLIEEYLSAAQGRLNKPLRKVTSDSRRFILGKFAADTGITRGSEISGPKITDWLIRLQAQGKSKDTIWTYGMRVRSFVKFLMPRRAPANALDGFILPDQPMQGRTNWVRSSEVSKLLDRAEDTELKFVLLCGFDAGFRRVEVSEARVNWFDLENRLIHVSNFGTFVTKDKSNRTIPMTDRFAEFLKDYLAGRKSGEYVLAPEKTAGVNKYRYDTAKRARSHFARHGVSASFHDMRRSFGSNRASAGVSIYKIANWLGDGIEVVERSYGHLAPQDREVNKGV